MSMTTVRRWAGPAAVAVLVLALYQWLVAPSITSLRDDLTFLHQARVAAIQQAQKAK